MADGVASVPQNITDPGSNVPPRLIKSFTSASGGSIAATLPDWYAVLMPSTSMNDLSSSCSQCGATSLNRQSNLAAGLWHTCFDFATLVRSSARSVWSDASPTQRPSSRATRRHSISPLVAPPTTVMRAAVVSRAAES